MDEIDALKKTGFAGATDDSPATLDHYSHDASMFELRPKLVVKPKNAADVEKLVKLVADRRRPCPTLA